MSDLMAIGLELAVVAAGLGLLLLDLWTPAEDKRVLGWLAVVAVGGVLLASFVWVVPESRTAFGGMYVLDSLALYFKRFFLLAALFVLVMSVEFAERLDAGGIEFQALTLFALAGMMFAASANDFSMLFVSIELITVSFYVLTAFQRRRRASLEAGVKYLILGALSSAFLVFGIAWVYGASGTLSFTQLSSASGGVLNSRVLQFGVLFVLVGLGFKMAVVPFQLWAPDVYEGAPTPVTAFLAAGSKAAGVVLLIRVFYVALPTLGGRWVPLLLVLAGLTILYGALGGLAQRNVKRLIGYSSIANAGYLLLGLATYTASGLSAVLYYLAGYLFAVMATFLVLVLITRQGEAGGFAALSGLHRRSPLLAATLAVAMVSLAGVPPLAGFFGKLLVIKAALARGAEAAGRVGFYALVGVAVLGAVISLYYYLGVIRAVYWPEDESGAEVAPIVLSIPARVSLWLCLGVLAWLGTLPESAVNLAETAAHALRL
jgi:NADH-quinone oxidoreductase subunit N